MDSVKRSVIIGALLHDIGKIGQRAFRKDTLSSKTLDRESDICPSDPRAGYSTHLHVLWTDEFFSDNFSGDLTEHITGQKQTDFDTNPQNLASFHHKPASSLQKLIQIADRVSSGERTETERGERNDYILKRLSSVFNKVSLRNDPDERLKTESSQNYFYDLVPLSLGKDTFPVKGAVLLTADVANSRAKYESLWNGFTRGFKELSDRTIADGVNFTVFLDGLYHLLMKYTWCVPSYTNGKYDVDNDISLFDHSRTTAAIASCLYDLYGMEEVPDTASGAEFILLEGDISGIQKFLYRVSQPGGFKGAAKLLRGRSMFLSLLPVVTSYNIAQRLDQTFINILYTGGGKFQMLLPGTEKVKAGISEAAEEMQQWLFSRYRGELGIVTGFTEASRSELGRDFAAVTDRLDAVIRKSKSAKFFSEFFKDGTSGGSQTDSFICHQESELCSICGSFDDDLKVQQDDDHKLCGICRSHIKAGTVIPGAKYLVLAPAGDPDDTSLSFGKFGSVSFHTDKHSRRLSPDHSFFWNINNCSDDTAGFRFLGLSVPRAAEDIDSKAGVRSIEGEDAEGYLKGDIITFDDLAGLSVGDRKVGILRMDLDHLGLVFSLGLSEIGGSDGALTRSGPSISRSAMMSRMLDWFFSGYLNTICSELSGELADSTVDDSIKRIRKSISPHFYIVYSGGDDLFIAGPWDEAVELAFRIRHEHKEFTCFNSDIDISGGLSVVRARFPVSRSGELAGLQEGLAKKERGSLSALGETGTWEELEWSIEFGKTLERALTGRNGNRLPRGLLNRILETSRQLEKLEEHDQRRLLHIPELIYTISRNVGEGLKVSQDGGRKSVKELLVTNLINRKKGVEESTLGIRYALLKTRRR